MSLSNFSETKTVRSRSDSWSNNSWDSDASVSWESFNIYMYIHVQDIWYIKGYIMIAVLYNFKHKVTQIGWNLDVSVGSRLCTTHVVVCYCVWIFIIYLWRNRNKQSIHLYVVFWCANIYSSRFKTLIDLSHCALVPVIVHKILR